jgi:hypothetical protein
MAATFSGPDRHPSTDVWFDRLPARLALVPAPCHSAVYGVWRPHTRQPPANGMRWSRASPRKALWRRGLFLSITAWDKAPGRLRLANRDVRLVWFADEARHTVVLRYGMGSITLLVIPRRARAESASRALALAGEPGSAAGAEDILTACMACRG